MFKRNVSFTHQPTSQTESTGLFRAAD